MSSSDEWKDAIRTKLCSVFEGNEESLVHIQLYLNQDEIAYENSGNSPVWRTLKSLLTSDDAFKQYAIRMAEDSKRAERDPDFRETMDQIYGQMMEPSDCCLDETHHQSWELIRNEDFEIWGQSVPTRILELIPKMISNQSLLSSVDEVVSLVNKAGGDWVMVGLAVAFLCKETFTNINRWLKDEITGKRCCKNILDTTFSLGAGIGGGVGGATVGTFILPGIGTVIGGIAGGIISAQMVRIVSDRLTQYFFGIPKEEALENAYNYFGVPMTASNSAVNAAFHKKCLEHHPDKGGCNVDFHIVQVNMKIIRIARNY